MVSLSGVWCHVELSSHWRRRGCWGSPPATRCVCMEAVSLPALGWLYVGEWRQTRPPPPAAAPTARHHQHHHHQRQHHPPATSRVRAWRGVEGEFRAAAGVTSAAVIFWWWGRWRDGQFYSSGCGRRESHVPVTVDLCTSACLLLRPCSPPCNSHGRRHTLQPSRSLG